MAKDPKEIFLDATLIEFLKGGCEEIQVQAGTALDNDGPIKFSTLDEIYKFAHVNKIKLDLADALFTVVAMDGYKIEEIGSLVLQLRKEKSSFNAKNKENKNILEAASQANITYVIDFLNQEELQAIVYDTNFQNIDPDSLEEVIGSLKGKGVEIDEAKITAAQKAAAAAAAEAQPKALSSKVIIPDVIVAAKDATVVLGPQKSLGEQSRDAKGFKDRFKKAAERDGGRVHVNGK